MLPFSSSSLLLLFHRCRFYKNNRCLISKRNRQILVDGSSLSLSSVLPSVRIPTTTTTTTTCSSLRNTMVGTVRCCVDQPLSHQDRQQQQQPQQQRRYYSYTFSKTTTAMMMTSFDTNESFHDDTSRWKIAIVGSGPSGCYTAKYLQQAIQNMETNNHNVEAASSSSSTTTTTPTTKKIRQQEESYCQIDVLERLPTAYGLVRNGVAPDHPEVKNVQNDFDELFSSRSDGTTVRFFGNVQVGRDVSLDELRSIYDIVVLAFGCESDRTLNVPGNNYQHILTARQFVNWYNGHPEFDWVGPIVQQALNENNVSPKNIVVIGHGNVALDCARILAKTRDELVETDLTTRALEVLHPTDNNTVHRNISIVGRRGHVQGAFTIKEVRELTKLPNANFVVLQDELDAGSSTEASQQELKTSKPKQRIDALLRDNATTNENKETNSHNVHPDMTTTVHLRFLLNPIRFEPRPSEKDVLGAVVCERTQLQGGTGKQSAVGTGEHVVLPADLCLVSIGYKGIPIAGTEDYYDDQKGILKNDHGVVDNDSTTTGLAPLYVSGWLKRGPSGIIGTNITDAKDTVASIMKELQQQQQQQQQQKNHKSASSSSTTLMQLLDGRGVKVIDWESYLRINATETNPNRLRSPQQPREKLTERKDLLQAAAKK
ncbi:pyridine nucleotide-disulfide oxidoreductase [Nitzschia inconspicua]|uniref:Pyridine nucleotide-disulfide oxidoreductase n=1 Tax=Nitzschia inconspicua TaxID=303405 RepID=A0A9K3LKI0_9STRA|nr:pyridine nucleotide-disulfide oxidoreductase [Nitzschia inconspicua]